MTIEKQEKIKFIPILHLAVIYHCFRMYRRNCFSFLRGLKYFLVNVIAIYALTLAEWFVEKYVEMPFVVLILNLIYIYCICLVTVCIMLKDQKDHRKTIV